MGGFLEEASLELDTDRWINLGREERGKFKYHGARKGL